MRKETRRVTGSTPRLPDRGRTRRRWLHLAIAIALLTFAAPLQAVEITPQPPNPTVPAGGSTDIELQLGNPNPGAVEIDKLDVTINSIDDATIEASAIDQPMVCTATSDRQARCTSSAPFTLGPSERKRVRVRVRVGANAQQGTLRRVNVTAITTIAGSTFPTTRQLQVRIDGTLPAPLLEVQITRPDLITRSPDGTFTVPFTIVVRNSGTASTGSPIVTDVLRPKAVGGSALDLAPEWSSPNQIRFTRQGSLAPGEQTAPLVVEVRWPYERGRYELQVLATDGTLQAQALSSISVSSRLSQALPDTPPAAVRGRRN
jgi:hypothetical protein